MVRRRFAVALTFLLCAGATEAAQFDRTVSAPRGTHLDVRLYAGQVVVRAWDRDAVRVRATHFSTDEIDLRKTGQAFAVRARARRGVPHGIDLEIDVPAWMAVDVAGTYLDVAVEGTAANVAAEINDPQSLLSYYRNWIAARRRSSGLMKGDIVVLDGRLQVLTYIRTATNERVVVVHNLSNVAVDAGPLPLDAERLESVYAYAGVSDPTGSSGDWHVNMPAHSSGSWRLR